MVGSPITTTSFDQYLKQTFIDTGDIIAMIQDGQDDPFVESWEHDEEAFGDSWKIPVITSTNVRVGASFTTAQNLGSNQKGYAFVIPVSASTQIYAVASFDSPTLRASSGNSQAFFSVVKNEMDSTVAALHMKVATHAHRDGTGTTAYVNSAASAALGTGYLQLANASDIHLFEVGDVVVASQTAGGTLRSGSAPITGIDLDTGSLVFSTTPNTLITGLTASDALYRTAADAANAGTNVCFSGFQAWVPPPPSGTSTVAALTVSYFGVVRSAYQSKLAGLYFCNNGSLGGPADAFPEAMVKFASKIQANGAKKLLNLISMNPADYAILSNSVSTKLVQLPSSQADAKISVAGLGVLTDHGVIPVKQSNFTPQGFAEFISTSTWTFGSSGKMGILDEDGLTVARSATADAWESRLGAINVQLACRAPGYNGLLQL